jgi:hypothetical protein
VQAVSHQHGVLVGVLLLQVVQLAFSDLALLIVVLEHYVENLGELLHLLLNLVHWVFL